MQKKVLLYGTLLTVTLIAFAGVSSAESLTPALCKAKAIAAAKLLDAEGEAALEKIKDPVGEFSFADGAGYVWVHNLDGNMVMHPVKPALDGKNLLAIRDVDGVYLFVAMNEIAEEYGAGWVPYAWPKPGQEGSSPKISYVVLSVNYVVGAGMYDVTADDIKAQFPDDPIYEINNVDT